MIKRSLTSKTSHLEEKEGVSSKLSCWEDSFSNWWRLVPTGEFYTAGVSPFKDFSLLAFLIWKFPSRWWVHFRKCSYHWGLSSKIFMPPLLIRRAVPPFPKYQLIKGVFCEWFFPIVISILAEKMLISGRIFHY